MSLSATLAAIGYTDVLLGESETCYLIRADFESAPISDKMKALLNIAKLTQRGGRFVTESAVARAKDAGATDLEKVPSCGTTRRSATTTEDH